MDSILITGIGGPAGRAAAAFFRSKGLRIIGTDIVPVEDGGDVFRLVPRGDDPLFPDALITLFRTHRPVGIVPTVTEELVACATLRPILRNAGCRMFISAKEPAAIANDKFLSATTLQTRGVPVPRTLLAGEVRDARHAGTLLGYPLIAKPRFGRGGRGVTVIMNERDAQQENRTDIVYQEFMPGREYDANVFAFPAGIARASVILWKSILKEGAVGNAVAVERASHPAVSRVAEQAVRALQLEGPLDMDIRLGADGNPYILEINGRVGANALTAHETLEALYSALFGED